MAYCKNCKVSINGSNKTCPLCGNIIENNETSDIFPYIQTVYKQYNSFFKMLILISILISMICIFINIVIPTNVIWCTFVVAGFLCLLLILKITLNSRYNIFKTILRLVFVVSILTFLWDYFTGWHNWSITYVIPIICLCGSIDIVIVANVRKIYINEYLVYFLAIMFLGFVQILFLILNMVTIKYPTQVCIFLNMVSFIAILFMEWDNVKTELKRRLHI